MKNDLNMKMDAKKMKVLKCSKRIIIVFYTCVFNRELIKPKFIAKTIKILIHIICDTCKLTYLYDQSSLLANGRLIEFATSSIAKTVFFIENPAVSKASTADC